MCYVSTQMHTNFRQHVVSVTCLKTSQSAILPTSFAFGAPVDRQPPVEFHQELWRDRTINKCSVVAKMGDRLATINMGRKLREELCPFWGGAGSPCNKIWPGSRPTLVPSGILIHPAIWSQEIWAKIGGCAPLGEGQLGPHLTQCGQGRGPSACQVCHIH